MCLYPKLIKNPKYTSTKKNGGNIPPIQDPRVLMVPVGCGKCIECRKQEKTKWQVRLLEDVRHNKNAKFVTLTFSNESIAELAKEIKGLKGYDLDNEIATLAVRRFLERWRKKYDKSIRHWLITELGHEGTEHVHMHGIMWSNEELDKKLETNNISLLDEIENIWSYGWVWKGAKHNGNYKNFVNEKTVNYITKYVHKIDKDHEYYKAKVLTSAGIGRNYIDRTDSEKHKFNGTETKETYRSRTGHEIALPIYWRNKVWTEEEREKLWLIKLDKQERWVCGEKVDISNGEEEYYKLLEWHRQRNRRLGYGDDSINWDKKKYENERRQLKINERIAKGKVTGSRRTDRFARSAQLVRPIEPNEASPAVYGGIKPNENINWEEM